MKTRYPNPLAFVGFRIIFHSVGSLLAHLYPHSFSSFGWLLSSSGKTQSLLPSLSSRDLEMEGSAVLSGHLPSRAPQTSWGKFDGQF